MRVKLFAGSTAGELEEAINAWLAANPKVEVAEIRQSAAGGGGAEPAFLVSLWYLSS